MTTVKAVKEPENDPKQGKARPKSGVSFPYYDLAQSIEVAKVMHEKAGGQCDRAQLATLLDYSGVNNGSFLTRVSAAKMFGLIEETDDQKLRVSARGRAIVAPVSPEQATRAKVDAFLGVDLFKKVYDEYHGQTLPEQVGLRNLLLTRYQVVPDRIPATVRIMLNSAEQAGLFTVAGNRTRMVMPVSGTSVTHPPTAHPPAEPPVQHTTPPRREGGGGGNGGDGGGTEIDPALLGLLRRLPPIGEKLNSKRRKVVIDAFTSFVALVYPDDESDA
jgi:hypothetical protein